MNLVKSRNGRGSIKRVGRAAAPPLRLTLIWTTRRHRGRPRHSETPSCRARPSRPARSAQLRSTQSSPARNVFVSHIPVTAARPYTVPNSPSTLTPSVVRARRAPTNGTIEQKRGKTNTNQAPLPLLTHVAVRRFPSHAPSHTPHEVWRCSRKRGTESERTRCNAVGRCMAPCALFVRKWQVQ